ncbi:MAG: suppressor of fused domain protein [Pelagimonas sp.]|uniref:suppressor of fused domain protein n=1 Tax=Pelagimonas sp. TaxID=2073170 RepID=UPI003D6ACE0E
MQDQWTDGEITPGGSEIIMGETRDVDWEAPETHAENIEEIETFLHKALGVEDHNVFHEILSDKVHLDVLVYPPAGDRDYYLYVTSGMSDVPMSLPEGLSQDEFGRTELIMALPRAWGEKVAKLDSSASDPDNVFWPISVMKWLARYPHVANTWVGAGHTIPNGPDAQPYDDTTLFNGVILSYAPFLPLDMDRLRLPSGDYISFLGVVFLHPGEMDLKLEKGADELFERLYAQGQPEILDLSRRSVVRTNPILRLLKGP